MLGVKRGLLVLEVSIKLKKRQLFFHYFCTQNVKTWKHGCVRSPYEERDNPDTSQAIAIRAPSLPNLQIQF